MEGGWQSKLPSTWPPSPPGTVPLTPPPPPIVSGSASQVSFLFLFSMVFELLFFVLPFDFGFSRGGCYLVMFLGSNWNAGVLDVDFFFLGFGCCFVVLSCLFWFCACGCDVVLFWDVIIVLVFFDCFVDV